MPADMVISFPHMGNYAALFGQLASRLFPRARILPAPPITRKTVELGGRYSPDFVCSPFKFNLGNYIEALDAGANVLFQTGMGCRYGYYGELQEQILRDLGYDFKFICLSRRHARPFNLLHTLRELGCELSVARAAAAFNLTMRGIYELDRYEYWMRENVGFETEPGGLEEIGRNLLEDICRADSLGSLRAAAAGCREMAGKVSLERPEHPLRVGIVGELYTLMEPFSNFFLEKQLAGEGISVSRMMGIWFLLIGRSDTRSLKQSGGYLKYTVGANGVDSAGQSLIYARKGYDGILHLKSFGCIPELNAAPALDNISRGERIPMLHLSFDSHTSETGVRTRLEAFSDMLRMKKENENAGNRKSWG